MKRYRDEINEYKENAEQLSKETFANFSTINNLNDSFKKLKLVNEKLEVKLHDIEMENTTQIATFKIKMNNPSITCHRKPDDESAYMIKIITGTNI